MKVTPIENVVKVRKMVEVEEIDTVGITIDLTKTEASYLFHLLGKISPKESDGMVRDSIKNYYPCDEYLLENYNTNTVDRLVITPLYYAIKKAFNIKMI